MNSVEYISPKIALMWSQGTLEFRNEIRREGRKRIALGRTTVKRVA
jgi:hypothetical protein